jgi:hypothetical protein
VRATLAQANTELSIYSAHLVNKRVCLKATSKSRRGPYNVCYRMTSPSFLGQGPYQLHVTSTQHTEGPRKTLRNDYDESYAPADAIKPEPDLSLNLERAMEGHASSPKLLITSIDKLDSVYVTVARLVLERAEEFKGNLVMDFERARQLFKADMEPAAMMRALIEALNDAFARYDPATMAQNSEMERDLTLLCRAHLIESINVVPELTVVLRSARPNGTFNDWDSALSTVTTVIFTVLNLNKFSAPDSEPTQSPDLLARTPTQTQELPNSQRETQFTDAECLNCGHVAMLCDPRDRARTFCSHACYVSM